MMSRNDSKEVPPENRRNSVQRVEITLFTMIKAVLVAAGIWMLIKLLPAVLALVLALMLVGALNPVEEWVAAHGVGRDASILIVFGMLLVAVFLTITLTIPAVMDQVKSLIDQAPELHARAMNLVAGTSFGRLLENALRNLQYDALVKSVAPPLLAFSTRIVEILAYSVAAVFLALYIMVDREWLRGALFAAAPPRHHRRLRRILQKLQTIVGGYIRGQVITSVVSALYVFAVMTAFGIPNAVAIAVFAGIADALPVIGLLLTMILAGLAALAKSPITAAIVFVLILCYEEFESRVLVPLVYGRALRLPSSVVLFSLLAGGVLGGIIGALLALPVAAAILMLIEEFGVALPDEDNDGGGAEAVPAQQAGNEPGAGRPERLD
jgi:predicted PurR-regulated permease PerM